MLKLREDMNAWAGAGVDMIASMLTMRAKAV
jgi:hypothetical protein